ncbi:MAG: GNAT family N-acetyltransferase [Deltaproteobacteria bacterium]|nr:GNAT family N-acetyltransferase [Deltaproteobacteria bacterium]
MSDKNLTTLTLNNDPRLFVAVADLVSSTAETHGFPPNEAGEIGKLTRNVLEHLFGINAQGNDDAPFKISIFIRSCEFFVSFEYKGLPIELKDDNSNSESPFSLSISSPAIDRVNLINRGKEGQSLELIKILPTVMCDFELSEELSGNSTEKIPVLGHAEDLDIRMIRPDEGVRLARCFYRVYGYTYGPRYVYSPDLLNILIESGKLVSAVAVDKAGEVVAHGAMRRTKPDDRVAELISLAVDPEFRGVGLAAKIHLYLMNYARGLGLRGVFGEAVTIHPFSQRLCRSLGGKESAVMPGYIPPAYYKGIADNNYGKRQVAIVYFFPLDLSSESGRVFAPLNYQDILKKIYGRLGLYRDFGSELVVPWGISCGETSLSLVVSNDINSASIVVNSYCPDTAKVIEFRLKQLIKEGIEYISLDLPLGDPLTPYFSQELETMGFFFSGVIPHLVDGDALRLQFLNTREINFDSASIESKFAKELVNYVISKRNII